MIRSVLPNDMYPRVLRYVRYRTEIGKWPEETAIVVKVVCGSDDLWVEGMILVPVFILSSFRRNLGWTAEYSSSEQ